MPILNHRNHLNMGYHTTFETFVPGEVVGYDYAQGKMLTATICLKCGKLGVQKDTCVCHEVQWHYQGDGIYAMTPVTSCDLSK